MGIFFVPIAAVVRRAEEHRRTPMIGRTHGVHAEPMTFGLKLAQAHAEARHPAFSFPISVLDALRFESAGHLQRLRVIGEADAMPSESLSPFCTV